MQRGGKMSLNDELKMARKAKGLTQDDVAKALGAKNTTISNWENGVSRPDVDSLSALCKLYGVTPNDILEYDYEPETIAAHHDGEDWTEEELEEIENFKKYVKSKRG